MRKLMVILFSLLALLAQAETPLSLAEVSSFDNSHIGMAGSPSPNFAAFQSEVNRGDKAAPLFEKLLQEGKPAARIYAALGLYSLDRSRGLAALESLKSDPSKVRTTNGCMTDETTVGEAVTELLANDGEAITIYVRP